jgi:hypothetical protein
MSVVPHVRRMSPGLIFVVLAWAGAVSGGVVWI